MEFQKQTILYLVILVHLCAFDGKGQGHSFTNFSMVDGLPTNEVYHLIQDQQQRLLISSDHGLLRYDGNQFTQLPFAESKFSGSTLFNLKKDEKGVIWTNSYRHGMFFLDGDSLRQHPANDAILASLRADFINDFVVTDSGRIWWDVYSPNDTSVHYFEFFEVDAQGKVRSHLFPHQLDGEHLISYVMETPGGELACRNRSFFDGKLNESPLKGQPTRAFDLKQGWALETNLSCVSSVSFRNGPVLKTMDGYWLAVMGCLYFVSDELRAISKYPFEKGVLHLFESDHGLFVSTHNGVYVLRNGKPVSHLLKGHSVSHAYRDHEGGYWFSTIDQGVFYLSSIELFELTHPSIENQFIRSLAANDTYLLVGSYLTSLSLFNVTEDSVEWSHVIPLDQQDPKEVWLSSSMAHFSGAGVWLPGAQRRGGHGFEYKATNNTKLDVCARGDSLVVWAGEDGVSLINAEGTVLVPLPLDNQRSYAAAVHLLGNRVVVGTNHGLFSASIANPAALTAFSAMPPLSVNDIAALNDSVLIVSTKTNGVFFIDGLSGTILNHLNKKTGLSSNVSGRIAVEADSVVWVTSNAGLNRIVFTLQGVQVQTLLTSNGLVTNQTNDLALINGWLFTCSGHGVNYFRTSRLDLHFLQTAPRINQLKANGQDVTLGPDLVLTPHQRHLRFDYDVLTFKNKQAIIFAYRIPELDSQWVWTDEKHATFARLSPGSYTFELKAGFDRSKVTTAAVSFRIPPFFYEQLWFKAMVFILSLLITLSLSFMFFRQREQRLREKWELSRVHLKALSLQMNPHFLYNALNTVQHLSLTADHGTLSSFVGDLARLSRSVLGNSRKLLISLDTELENVERYLKLEQHRESTPFSYRFIIDPDLDLQKTCVPPLLLQPIVENALLHGLYPKRSGERLLEIECRNISGGFLVNVRDNGDNGFPDNATHAVKNNNSLGLDNTRSRLGLYQDMQFGEASFTLRSTHSSEDLIRWTVVSFTFLPNHKTIHFT